jgi:hypothetical protein
MRENAPRSNPGSPACKIPHGCFPNSAGRPVHRPAPQYMDVYVVDGLSCLGIRIHHEPEPAFGDVSFPRDFVGSPDHVSDELVVLLSQLQ